MASSSGDILQAAVALAVGGGGVLFRALKNHKRFRKIADTPRSKTASAPQGFNEFEGFAWPKDDTIITLNGEEAVYYSLELQQEQSSGSGKNRRTHWVKVFSFEHSSPFFLLDPTGVVIINPGSSADLDITDPSSKRYSKLSGEAKIRLQEFVNGTVTSFPPSESFFGKMGASKFQVVEKKILVGSPMCAMGNFSTEAFNLLTIDDSLYTFANKVIDFNSRTFKKVTSLLDTNKDGKISAQEAIAGYSMAAKVSRQNPQQQTAPIEIFGTLSSSDNHRLFFTDKHEQQLLESLSRFHNTKVIGGAAMIAIAVCMTLLRVGVIANPIERAKEKERQQIAKQQQAQAEAQYQVRVLHDACVNGGRGFCRQLIERQKEFGLGQQHITYYRDRGCQLGEISFCNDRQTASDREVPHHQ